MPSLYFLASKSTYRGCGCVLALSLTIKESPVTWRKPVVKYVVKKVPVKGPNAADLECLDAPSTATHRNVSGCSQS